MIVLLAKTTRLPAPIDSITTPAEGPLAQVLRRAYTPSEVLDVTGMTEQHEPGPQRCARRRNVCCDGTRRRCSCCGFETAVRSRKG